MAKPNTNFELSVEDIDIIEHALRHKINRLNVNRQTSIESTIKPEHELDSVKIIDKEIRKIYDLMGRLHHQKEWYRPKDGFVGGG